MKVEAGIFQYPFPGGFIEGGCYWNEDPRTHPGEVAYPLTIVGPEDMVTMHAKVNGQDLRAQPVYIAAIGDTLWFYPVPHKDGIAAVRYSTIHEM